MTLILLKSNFVHIIAYIYYSLKLFTESMMTLLVVMLSKYRYHQSKDPHPGRKKHRFFLINPLVNLVEQVPSVVQLSRLPKVEGLILE